MAPDTVSRVALGLSESDGIEARLCEGEHGVFVEAGHRALALQLA
jgi:hypothetical protein